MLNKRKEDERQMRSMKKVWSAIVAAVLLASMLTGCSQKEEGSVPELLTPAAVGESTIKVERRDFYSVDNITVSVVPETIELYFTMEGKIQDLTVNKGQLVKEGEVLAVIDQSDLLEQIKDLQEDIAYTETQYGYQLDQASLSVQIAQAKYAKLQDEYEKQEKLKKEAEAAAKAAAENPLVQQGTLWLAEENSLNEESTKAPENEEETSAAEESSEASEGSTPEESSAPEESSESSEVSEPEESSESSEISAPEESSAAEESSESSVPEESSRPVVEDPGVKPVGITNYDLKQAQLLVEQEQLVYSQKQDEYDQKLSQQQKKMQTLLSKVGEDTLKAPFDGRVVDLKYNEGDRVGDYDTVMILANENTMMLRGDKYSNSSLKKMRVDVLIDTEVYEATYVPYDDEEYYQAGLKKIVLPSRFTFTPGPNIKFGQSGTVRVYREFSEDTLVVPKGCVHTDDIGDYVYKVDNGVRSKTYITVGIRTKTHIEVIDGLNEGDEIYGSE